MFGVSNLESFWNYIFFQGTDSKRRCRAFDGHPSFGIGCWSHSVIFPATKDWSLLQINDPQAIYDCAQFFMIWYCLLSWFNCNKILRISLSWYKIYVHPIVCEYWSRMQSSYIENAPEVIKLTGDGQVWPIKYIQLFSCPCSIIRSFSAELCTRSVSLSGS